MYVHKFKVKVIVVVVDVVGVVGDVDVVVSVTRPTTTRS